MGSSDKGPLPNQRLYSSGKVNMKCLKHFLQKLSKVSHAHWLIFIINKSTDRYNFIHCAVFLLSHFDPAINHFEGFVIVRGIDVSFLCVCSLIDDKLRRNIVKVAVEITRLRLPLAAPEPQLVSHFPSPFSVLNFNVARSKENNRRKVSSYLYPSKSQEQ